MDDAKPDERLKRSRPFSRTIVNYSNASTIHGIYYIFERGRWILERFFWIVVVSLSIFYAVYSTWQAWVAWQDDPMITSIATTGLPIQKIPFPSITICAQGIIHKMKKSLQFDDLKFM